MYSRLLLEQCDAGHGGPSAAEVLSGRGGHTQTVTQSLRPVTAGAQLDLELESRALQFKVIHDALRALARSGLHSDPARGGSVPI